MSNAPALIAAEKRHAASVGVPGTLLIDSVKVPCRVYVARGTKFQIGGGTIQARTLNAVILRSALHDAKLIDDKGETRSILLQHVESGLNYRIDPGGVNLSPYQIYWSIQCSQPTTR